MQVGERALWLIGARPRLCRIREVYGDEVDLEFGDLSTRGRVPVRQLELLGTYEPLPFEQSETQAINPQGIDSEEGMGRF